MGTNCGPFPFGTCSAVRISPLSISFQPPAANNDPLSTPSDEARPPGYVPSRAFSRVYDHARVAAKRVAPYSTEEVAEFLGVDPRSVRRWVATYRQAGGSGLVARPTSGRPPKLTHVQEKIIRRWLADKPTEHGIPTDLRTGATCD